MDYIDVPESEARDSETGKIRPGYEAWAYSYKRVIPDTPEEIAAREASSATLQAAKTDMKALPGWATWTADQAEQWLTTNLGDLTTGAQRAALITAIKSMAKAICYLRDHTQITR